VYFKISFIFYFYYYYLNHIFFPHKFNSITIYLLKKKKKTGIKYDLIEYRQCKWWVSLRRH
jgi:hypothetical protein